MATGNGLVRRDGRLGVSPTDRKKPLFDSKSNRFERAYDEYIRAVEGDASAKEVENLLVNVARERAGTVDQIGRKISLLMGRSFQENRTDPEWLLLCSIKRDLSALLIDRTS